MPKVVPPVYYVRADIQDYNLAFWKRKDAECYRKMLLASDSHIPSAIIRKEITADGYHLTE